MPEKDLLQIIMARLHENWDALFAIGIAFIGSLLSYLQRMREGKVGLAIMDAIVEVGSSWFFASLAFGFASAIGLSTGASLAVTGYCAFKGAAWTSTMVDNLVKNRMQ